MQHIPVRECILCHEKYEKSKLLRVVKNEHGIKLDETHKKEGRGAYICSKCRNSENLYKKRVLDRAFKQKVSDEIYDLLKGEKDG